MFVNAHVCMQECKLLNGKISKLWNVEILLYIVENFPSKHIKRFDSETLFSAL